MDASPNLDNPFPCPYSISSLSSSSSLSSPSTLSTGFSLTSEQKFTSVSSSGDNFSSGFGSGSSSSPFKNAPVANNIILSKDFKLSKFQLPIGHCNICRKPFYDPFQWFTCQLSHSHPYECYYYPCRITFETPQEADNHFEIEHKPLGHAKTYRCNMCYEVVENEQAVLDHRARHITELKSKPTFFSCERCDLKYIPVDIWVQHALSHEDVVIQYNKCLSNVMNKVLPESVVRLNEEKKKIISSMPSIPSMPSNLPLSSVLPLSSNLPLSSALSSSSNTDWSMESKEIEHSTATVSSMSGELIPVSTVSNVNVISSQQGNSVSVSELEYVPSVKIETTNAINAINAINVINASEDKQNSDTVLYHPQYDNNNDNDVNAASTINVNTETNTAVANEAQENTPSNNTNQESDEDEEPEKKVGKNGKLRLAEWKRFVCMLCGKRMVRPSHIERHKKGEKGDCPADENKIRQCRTAKEAQRISNEIMSKNNYKKKKKVKKS